MLMLRGLRAFSLSATWDDDGISCDAQGTFAGGLRLLERANVGGTCGTWTVRPVAELNDELTARYRLPIDVAAKAGALALIAKALNRGDLAMAAIVTVQMQFPDPPSLTKGVESANETMRRAIELHRSRLLKANWDPAKHPRAGAPPNPGWFAPATNEPEAANVVPAAAVGNPWDKPVILEGGGGGGFLAARWNFRSRAVCRGFCRRARHRRNHRPQSDRQQWRHPRAKRNQGFHFQTGCH
jgi:hypothetical protein